MAENPILNERYRLVEQIGSGGMAVLYRAQDTELGRTVAVKVLRPSLVNDPDFVIRFKHEARSAANLSHPNIVTVHDVGQDGPNAHYIVMEYVPGQNLKQLVRTRGAFEVDATLAVITEVCKGVGYAHRAGLVHCDIKPQNILVTPENRIKVVDFGIARAFSADDPGEREDIVWGSPSYFSPEQAVGEPPTPASDVYSIGIVLFEMLTGRLPFIGSGYQELAYAHLQDPPPSIQEVNPSLPSELDRIIQKTLSKEPANRYRTADQLGRILQSYSEQGMQYTSSFRVQQSDTVDVEPPPEMPDPLNVPSPSYPRTYDEPAESPEYTVPSLPPVDFEQLSRSRRPAAYTDEPQREYYEEEEEPGPDVYGIVLGIFAAALILGLIPLWFFVITTLTQ